MRRLEHSDSTTSWTSSETGAPAQNVMDLNHNDSAAESEVPPEEHEVNPGPEELNPEEIIPISQARLGETVEVRVVGRRSRRDPTIIHSSEPIRIRVAELREIC